MAYAALDDFLAEEEAEGLDYVIRFVYGVLTNLKPETCARMVEMREIIGQDELEDLVQEVTKAAGIE